VRLIDHPRRGVFVAVLPFALAATVASWGCASGGGHDSAQADSERYLRLGYVQLERGQTQQALESAQQAIDKDRKNADAHNFIGLIYMSLSQYDKAADALREAVKLNPYFTDAHNNLGVTYRELKEYDKALKEFELALNDKNYKTPEKVYLNVGNLYVAQGVMSEAVRSFERAVTLNPGYVLGHLALGDAYRTMGRAEQAAEQYRKVMSLAPDTPEAVRAKQLLDSGGTRSGS
jgi:type IV pilus biogenesis/stability protein PilW